MVLGFLWVLGLVLLVLGGLLVVFVLWGGLLVGWVVFGVRKAFGASSRKLVIQFVVENILLCLVGGVLGLALAKGVLLWLEGSGLIPYLKVNIDLAVFGYGLIITVLFGVVSGVIPAWKMSRLDPVYALKGAA
jgi:putative ABC transport system permease protein